MRLGTRRVLDLGAELSEDHRLLFETTHAFASGRVAPGAADRDEHERFPVELLPELAEHGLLAMKVPEADGGSALDNVGYVLAMAAIA